MALQTEFVELPLESLRHEAAVMKFEGWRFMQTHAVNGEAGIDLYYSFMKDGVARNYRISGVEKGTPVPSITDLFLAAFVFENEARELFGVDMRDIAIDFQGAMYAPAVSEPMTIISPEQKAAREKAAKAAAAKAAKEAAGSEEAPAGDAAAPKRRVFVMTPERRARLDAKLATMSPEKVAKVEAAVKAREAEAAQAASEPQAAPAAEKSADKAPGKQADAPKAAKTLPEVPERAVDSALEEKIALMSPEKAAKVRAALGLGGASDVVTESQADAGASKLDAEVESKLSMMAPEAADKVRAALAGAAANLAAKGGE